MDTENVDAVRKDVRDHYGRLSREGMGCCGTGGCCAADPGASAAVGYTAEQLAEAPNCCQIALDARRGVVECVPKTGSSGDDCCAPSEAPVRIRARTP